MHTPQCKHASVYIHLSVHSVRTPQHTAQCAYTAVHIHRTVQTPQCAYTAVLYTGVRRRRSVRMTQCMRTLHPGRCSPTHLLWLEADGSLCSLLYLCSYHWRRRAAAEKPGLTLALGKAAKSQPRNSTLGSNQPQDEQQQNPATRAATRRCHRCSGTVQTPRQQQQQQQRQHQLQQQRFHGGVWRDIQNVT